MEGDRNREWNILRASVCNLSGKLPGFGILSGSLLLFIFFFLGLHACNVIKVSAALTSSIFRVEVD
jgi:hypothetical protein